MEKELRIGLDREVRHVAVPLSDYEKHFVTLELRPVTEWGELQELYREFVRQLAEQGISIVYEKVFGMLTSRSGFTNMRVATYEQAGLPMPPMTFIEGSPIPSGLLSAIIVYGVKTIEDNSVEVRYLCESQSSLPCATLVVTAHSRALHLCEVVGKGDHSQNPSSQFQNALNKMRDFITQHGFSPKDIVRTWVYLKDIVRDYQSFNDARREFFAQNAIAFDSDANELPASTGIEGCSSEDNLITLDVYCIDKARSHCRIRRIYGNLQSETDGLTYQFKPTFARAMLVSDGEHKELQVSGTASIDRAGSTIFAGEPANQIRTALQVVTSLLEQCGFGIEDLCQVTYFFKDQLVYRHFEEVRQELGFQHIVGPCVIANVCRDDLLFEIDGIAMKRVPV